MGEGVQPLAVAAVCLASLAIRSVVESCGSRASHDIILPTGTLPDNVQADACHSAILSVLGTEGSHEAAY
jgi:hypothetical protein